MKKDLKNSAYSSITKAITGAVMEYKTVEESKSDYTPMSWKYCAFMGFAERNHGHKE